MWRHVFIGLVTLSASAGVAVAQDRQVRPTYTTYGTPGLIDMPTAESAPDAELSFTSSYFAGGFRNTGTFQILPRVSGSFRYSIIDNLTRRGTLYDRSFDLRFRFVDEGIYRPAVAVGFRDVIGTGVYSGEYFVATKHFTPRFAVTGGIGWGRFGSYNGIANPLGVIDRRFETRPGGGVGQGGTLRSGQWFRGDAAFFGGLEWNATDRLSFKVEYSSDAYSREIRRGNLFTRNSPFNFGASYRIRPGIELGAHYLYGSEFGLRLTFTTNPKDPPYPAAIGNGPYPVKPRMPDARLDTSWVGYVESETNIRTSIQQFFAEDGGLTLEALDFTGTSAEVRFRNENYARTPQAVGRVARIMTHVLPASVETFRIVPVEDGLPMSAVTVRRSDLEELEHAPDGSWQSYARAEIGEALPLADKGRVVPDLYPDFSWGAGPYVQDSLFDPDAPIRGDLGIQFSGRYTLRPGTYLNARVRQKVIGNIDEITRVSDSVLPHVRTDGALYSRNDWPTIPELTINQLFRPGEELYGRVTAGYLERMYGGLSAELLWKPVDSRFALGVEVNWAQQRDFDQLFGFQDYGVATGHVSGYWDMGNGFHAQVDAGRYLAGDWGATFTLDREFRNGWKVGAFATFTNVSFNDFGEGSFDKGLRFEVPLGTLTGSDTRETFTRTLRPIQRDGGARVEVAGRLYQKVRGYQEPDLGDEWGLFWR